MKTSLLVTILFLFSINLITAQISISVEAGANRTSIDIDDNGTSPFDREPGLGFYVGAVPKFSLGERVKIAPEVQYSLESFEWSGIDNRFHNIRVIPQIEYRIVKPLSLLAGFNITINAFEQVKNTLDANAQWVNLRADLIKTVDYSIAGGLRLYAFDRVNLTFKYYHGLNNISNLMYTDDNGQPLDFEEYSKTFQLGVGYSLSKKSS